MKNLVIMLVALALAAASTTGCEGATEEDPWSLNECTEDCEEENKERPELAGTFVSGHLGNYRSCPEDGYTGEESDGDAEPVSGDAPSGGACADGADCPSLMACEDAQITVRLQNTADPNLGENAARGLQVTTIELFDADSNSLAVLPLIDAINTDTNETFDGTLDAGAEVTLRVEFQGPSPYGTFDSDSRSGDAGAPAPGTHKTIDLTISAENHEDVVIESTELYAVPSVDT